MKTLYKISRIIAGVFLLAVTAVSCLPDQETMGDAGQTLVKITPGGYQLWAIDAKATVQATELFFVRKDANSEANLNSSTTVELTVDQSVLDAYNTENGTEYVTLPSNLFTTNPAFTAGKLTLTFAPGDFAKQIMITIPNATLFDFSKSFALGIKASVTGTGTLTQSIGKNAVVQVLVKNKFDGIYEVNEVSPMVDVLNATLTGWYPFTYELRTSGANSCLCYEPDYGEDYYHPITSGGAESVYGAFGLEVIFNDAGNIVDVKNPWGNLRQNHNAGNRSFRC